MKDSVLYDEELLEIIELMKPLKEILSMAYSLKHVELDWSKFENFTVSNVHTGAKLGELGITPDGEIGFMPVMTE